MTTKNTMSCTTSDDPLARHIAVMMRAGTAVASVLLAIGAVLVFADAGSATTVLLTSGCGLLVILPVVRLAMMTGHFARHAERRFTAATLAVLGLVLAGGAAGLLL